MAVVVANALTHVCQRVVLVTREIWLDALFEVIQEPTEGLRHPLFGLGVALQHATSPLALIAPCDVPFLTAAAVQALVDEGPSVAWDGDRIHPLLGVFPATWSERAFDFAARGRSAREFVDGMRRTSIDSDALRNVNRPDDLITKPVQES